MIRRVISIFIGAIAFITSLAAVLAWRRKKIS